MLKNVQKCSNFLNIFELFRTFFSNFFELFRTFLNFFELFSTFFNFFQLLSWTFPDLPGVSGTIRNAPKPVNPPRGDRGMPAWTVFGAHCPGLKRGLNLSYRPLDWTKSISATRSIRFCYRELISGMGRGWGGVVPQVPSCPLPSGANYTKKRLHRTGPHPGTTLSPQGVLPNIAVATPGHPSNHQKTARRDPPKSRLSTKFAWLQGRLGCQHPKTRLLASQH